MTMAGIPDRTRWQGWAGGIARAVHRGMRRWQIRLRHKRLVVPPGTINIELTGRCNVKPPCTFCVGKNVPGYQEPGHLTDGLALHWPDLLRAERVNDCSYGEPLLHPDFEEVVGRLTAAGVTFGFTTNGLLLTEKRARFLAARGAHLDMCVSFNAATAQTYHHHHGRDFATLLANIGRFVAVHEELRPGRSMPLVLSFIVMRSNQHEVLDFLLLAERLGARAALLRHLFDVGADYAANNFGHAFVYEEERLPFARYREIEAEVRRDFRGSRPAGGGRRPLEVYFAWNARDAFIAEQAEPGIDIPCLFPWKFLCVRPIAGAYTPCVYLKRKSVAASPSDTVEQVWNGEIMRGLRRSLAAGRVPEFCVSYGQACPLVVEERERRARAEADAQLAPGRVASGIT